MADFNEQAALLKALAHPVRLQILSLLRDGGEVCVCHMEAAIKKRQAYISQQLMVLRDAGLIDSRKDGRMVFYWIADDRALALLDQVLGPGSQAALAVVRGCGCPTCTTVAVSDIALNEQR
jgi:DNA-binding transcriptional ArsR family regulator